MTWLGLRHKGVEPLFPSEWNAVVDGLDYLKHYTDSLTVGKLDRAELQALASDIIPDQDNTRKLGDPSRSWSEVNAYYGYFREEVYVKGRKVIKDQDPIFIADIYEEAIRSISYAVDLSGKVSLVEIYTRRIEEHVRYIKENVVEPERAKVRIVEPLPMPVDKEADRNSISDEIDTSVASPPVTVLTPPSGKRISTRGVYVFSDSTSGEIEMRYKNSGKKIAKIYCTRYYNATLPEVRFDGDPDEPIEITWSGLSVNSKIFYIISYKIID